MTQLADDARQSSTPQEDLVGLVIKLLDQASEPISTSQIRRKLPRDFQLSDAEILAALRAPELRGMVFEYPAARGGPQAGPRFSTTPLDQAIESLLRRHLEHGLLTASQLQRKMGPFRDRFQEVLDRLVEAGEVHAVPPLRGRTIRYGSRPPDPVEFIQAELGPAVQRLIRRGLDPESIRQGIIALAGDESAFGQMIAQSIEAATPIGAMPEAEPPGPEVEPEVEPEQLAEDVAELRAELAELERLVLEILPEIQPPAAEVPVPIPELWQAVELKFPHKAAFDEVLRNLAGRGALDLHLHEQPETLSPEQRAQMVEHPAGGVFARVRRR